MFIGADVQQLREIASLFAASAEALEQSRKSVKSAIRISAWVGPIAANFRLSWDSQHSRHLHAAAELLRQQSVALTAHAAGQSDTSAASNSGIAPYVPFPSDDSVRVALREKARVDSPQWGANSPENVILEFSREGAYSSGVTIRTIVQGDGSRSHIVYIPGTQDWDNTTNNPFNVNAAASAAIGWETDVSRVVKEAMALHGIAFDEPVMLAGHSLGGLTAANLAADAEFRAAYEVKSVVVYGADVSGSHIPEGIQVTQVNNRGGDPVSMITGNVNGPMTAVHSLTSIDVFQPNIQQDRGEHGIIPFIFSDHNSTLNYARFASQWNVDHPGEWKANNPDFLTDSDATSSVARYNAHQTD